MFLSPVSSKKDSVTIFSNLLRYFVLFFKHIPILFVEIGSKCYILYCREKKGNRKNYKLSYHRGLGTRVDNLTINNILYCLVMPKYLDTQKLYKNCLIFTTFIRLIMKIAFLGMYYGVSICLVSFASAMVIQVVEFQARGCKIRYIFLLQMNRFTKKNYIF